MSKHSNRMSPLDYLRELIQSIKGHALDRQNILIPLILMILAIIAVLVGLVLGARALISRPAEPGAEESVAVAEEEIPLELGAVPELDELFRKYYDAVAAGDIETLRTLTVDMDPREENDLKVIGRYALAYPTVNVYSLPGPKTDSYVCYVETLGEFEGYEQLIPGMITAYVEKGEDGQYRIDRSPTDTAYIEKVSLHDDVVDLNNRVTAKYNDLLAEDPNFQPYIDGIAAELYSGEAPEGLVNETATPEAPTENETAENATEPLENESVNASSENVSVENTSAENVSEDPANASENEPEEPEETPEETPEEEVQEPEETPAESWDHFDGLVGDPIEEYSTVVVEAVHLRPTPSTESGSLVLMFPGTQVTVLSDRDHEWIKVRRGDQEGYIKSHLVR